MARQRFIEVEPGELFLPPSRISGADPAKLMRQISKFGLSTVGMPPLLCYQWPDGGLVIFDGVTRAMRVAKLMPGTSVSIQVLGLVSRPSAARPQIKDRLQ